MSDRWYRLPGAGDGSVGNPWRPDLLGHGPQTDGYSGNDIGNGSRPWIARVYGPDATLDDLAAESEAVELPGPAVQALNQHFGEDRDAAGWRRGFRTEVRDWPMPRVGSRGWHVRITHNSSGNVFTPEVRGTPTSEPAIRDLPRVRIPVRRSDKWEADGFGSATMEVWRDGTKLPIEQLDDVEYGITLT